MNNRCPSRALPILILGALVAAAPGCHSNTAGSAHARTTLPGRRIQARSDGPVSVQNFGDRAVVSLPSHELTIEPDRVLIDGADLAKLPADATHIEVQSFDGQLTVTADG